MPFIQDGSGGLAYANGVIALITTRRTGTIASANQRHNVTSSHSMMRGYPPRLILSSVSRSPGHPPQHYLKKPSCCLQEFFRCESLHSAAMAHTIEIAARTILPGIATLEPSGRASWTHQDTTDTGGGRERRGHELNGTVYAQLTPHLRSVTTHGSRPERP